LLPAALLRSRIACRLAHRHRSLCPGFDKAVEVRPTPPQPLHLLPCHYHERHSPPSDFFALAGVQVPCVYGCV